MRLSYRSDIDGLRAVSIILVILYHAYPDIFVNGFIGVDIFFVISGYLITRIISPEINSGQFSFLKFYERRVKRLFPALIFMLTTVLVAGYFLFKFDDLKSLGEYVVAASVFLTNFFDLYQIGYFEPAILYRPLMHLWSLGIEEQFYLLWPLTLFFLAKLTPKRIRILLFLLAASFSASLYFTFKNQPLAFNFPLTRFWELIAGAVLAIVHERGLGKPIAGYGWIGMLLVGVSFYVPKIYYFPGWWAVLPVMAALLFIADSNTGLVNRKILSNRVLVYIGVISYPLYLWHWPLLAFYNTIKPSGHVSNYIIGLPCK